MAVLFPIYFGSVCQAAGADNLVLWSYGTSVATFLVAILAPVLGSLADHKGHKKRLFVACLILGGGLHPVLRSHRRLPGPAGGLRGKPHWLFPAPACSTTPSSPT